MSDFTLNYGQYYTIESTVSNLQTSGGLNDFALLVFTGKTDLAQTDANAIFQKKLANGAGTSDIQIKTAGSGPSPSVNGVVWLIIEHADYAKLTPGIENSVDWDLWAVDASGKPYLLDSGTLTVLAHATQAVS